MAERNDSKGEYARTSRAERDLDRLLDTLVPPAPSDTLRARLKRDFAAGVSASRNVGGAGGRWWAPFENRIGGIAVAAALVLAVALGTLVPPSPRQAVPSVAQGGTASVTAADDLTDDELLAQAAPDSALYMIATYNADLVTGTASASDTGTGVSYQSVSAADTSRAGGDFGVMPLE